jgi:hypothetical protein
MCAGVKKTSVSNWYRYLTAFQSRLTRAGGGSGRDELIEALSTAYGKREDAIDTFNAEVAERRGPVEDAVNAYNEALERRCAYSMSAMPR